MKLRIQIPEGFTSDQDGIPEMRLPQEGTEAEDTWQAKTTIQGEEFLMDLVWRPLQRRYVGRVIVNQNWEQPRDIRSLAYPHEVILWLSRWFRLLQESDQP